MKKVSICVPCYNEEENVYPMYQAIIKQVKEFQGKYNYEILFADNASQDRTREMLKQIAENDKKVKLILNMRNFGPDRSGWNCLFRASGDVIVMLPCDFQVSPELINEYLRYWEQGELIVSGQRQGADGNIIKYHMRKLYYKIIMKLSDVPQYNQMMGLTVIDRQVIEVASKSYEPSESFRHLVAELGYRVKLIPYKEQERRAGKSSYNIARYYDFAITSLINTSFVPLRIATILGGIASGICFLIGVIYLIYKIIYWNDFNAGMAPVLIGIFFVGSIQLAFIGILGEYIGAILRKMSKHPLVVEEELVNFDE